MPRKKPSKMPMPKSRHTAKKGGGPRTSAQYFALSDTEQEKWNRVAHVLSKMRSEGISLTQASREFNVDRRLVVARAGSALRKAKNGRYSVKTFDRLLRVLIIPSAGGQTQVSIRDSRTTSKLAEYSDAVQKYLRTGDSTRLKAFRALKLVDENGSPIKLLTNLAELQRLGSAGVMSFESLYARVA